MEEARKALKLAQSHLERVRGASFDPPDHVEAVTFAFYAYENAIVAIAEARGVVWKKNHYDKAKLARAFFNDGVVSVDLGDYLLELNDMRKNAAYEGTVSEVEELDLEVLANNLEALVEEVEGIVEE